MAPRNTANTGGLVAVIAMIAIAGLFVLRPGTTEVSISDEGPITPPERGEAVVARLRETGGLSFFGLGITDSTHYAEVLFTTDPDCAALLQSEETWPTPHPECPAPVELVGEVATTGRTITGDSIVGVEFTVPGDCADLLEPGMPWPTFHPECDT